ncbi:hypothetical protein QAD02_003853 [Eretmocerus hayati]|uniref:Uncharacterized protein n=1 Tax=Eretmocerus hayati TaxID=131215 RepID=A0ACC2NMU5_9HYME|nr:hypothetical protein QAD02_003853 [Eretmocerus hayati]
MSGLLYTLLGLAASSSLHCAVRREISPCTCRQEDFSTPIVSGPAPISAPGDSGPGGGGGSLGGSGIGVGIPPPPHGERIEVECERMESFQQLAEALRGKFTPEQQITLRVSHSQLKDISKHGLKELRMSITKLELNYDSLG